MFVHPFGAYPLDFVSLYKTNQAITRESYRLIVARGGLEPPTFGL